jgi:16S rRNA (cytosine967-C5)-methyltransferase
LAERELQTTPSATPVADHPQPGGAGVAVRAAAARAVDAVCAHGRSLTEALAEASPAAVETRDQALLAELAFGTLRQLPRLKALTSLLVSRPFKARDRILEALLQIGLYQVLGTRIPAHAAVSATVAATRPLKRPWAAGLINAALRRFLREQEALLARIADDAEARWLLPLWLLERLRQAWPRDWQAVVEAGNGRAPMFLRVNPLRDTRDGMLARLAAAGIEARPLPDRPHGLVLAQPVPMGTLPGYADGRVSVQDAAAQWAAALLAPRPGEHLLDACAAPGGKTAHLLELGGGGVAVTAIEVDPRRLETLHANLRRLGLAATVLTGDAAAPATDWPGAPYHAILLDAPCSGTGVIRRHPDIKVLRRPTDIDALAARQAAMLDRLWPLLAPGGRLLYVTCSLLPEENGEQIRAFMARAGNARPRPLPAAVGSPCGHGRQRLPQPDDGDGFFFALLEKVPT